MKSTQAEQAGVRTSRMLTALIALIGLAGTAQAAEMLSNGPWRYTTRKPADGWQSANFDDASWQTGFGGFGEQSTPGCACLHRLVDQRHLAAAYCGTSHRAGRSRAADPSR